MKDLPEHNRFIHSEPPRNFIAIPLKYNSSIVDKIVNNLAAEPTTVDVLQIQGKVPMVQSHRRLNTILNTRIDNIVIVSKCQLIDRAISKGKDT